MLRRLETVERQRPVLGPPRSRLLITLLAAGVIGVASVATTSASTSRPGKAPTFAAACGTKPVTMQGYFETGFPLPIELTKEFTRQHRNVKWHIRQDQFAVITQNAPLALSGPNPPDLMRLPQLSGLVKDHLMKNLDVYFRAYGWNRFPASQLMQMRMPASGRPRGVGSLWAMGLNYSMTGVFYN